MSGGRLEVITGCMFSGKTEELIRRVKRAVIAKQKIIVYKPIIDTRYGLESIVSHGSVDLEKSTGVKPKTIDDFSIAIGNDYKEAQVVVFDEVQFFDKIIMIPTVSVMITKDKKRVICAGLDLDAFGNPFGGMPDLLAMADEITKLKSICAVCKADANRTFRTIKTSEQVVVGGSEAYEPRCIKCWAQ